MLKSDFHMHTSEDNVDFYIPYTAKEMIKHCAKLGYEVLSITNHALSPTHKCYYTKDLESYAKKHEVLLIPGMEARINNKDILLIDVPKETRKPATFRRVEILKEEGALIIAPHPLFKIHSLNSDFEKNIKLFDALEYSHSYTSYFNRNAPAELIAKKYNLPIVGTSDCHYLEQINKTYTLLDCDKTKDSVLEALRKNELKLVTRPLSTNEYISIMSKMMLRNSLIKAFYYKAENSVVMS